MTYKQLVAGETKPIPAVRAFGYLRVSGKSQVQGDGFTRQHLALKQYCAVHNVQLVRVFQEAGVSGTIENMDRPAWQDLMIELHSNGVKTILIEKLDRLSRDLLVQESVIGDLKKHGFSLISTMEPDLLSNDPTRVMFRQFLGAIAQYEKTQLVFKLRGARARMKASTGRCEGRKPFGETQGEQDTLHFMQSMHKAGVPYEKIAARLNVNEQAWKPRMGKKWYPASVRRILLAQPVTS